MFNKGYIALIFIVAALIAGCEFAYSRLDQAIAGVERTIAGLPATPRLELIAEDEKHEVFRLHGKACDYGVKVFIYGSSMSGLDALDYYMEVLQEAGWQVAKTVDYDTGRYLIRGKYESITVSTPPLVDLDSTSVHWLADYGNIDEIKQRYNSVLDVWVRYILPSRDG